MSADAIQRLQEMQAKITKLLEQEDTRAEKLVTEAEGLLLMADALSILRDISTRNLSESQRARRAGVMKRLSDAMRVA
jgi:hypothetical protein